MVGFQHFALLHPHFTVLYSVPVFKKGLSEWGNMMHKCNISPHWSMTWTTHLKDKRATLVIQFVINSLRLRQNGCHFEDNIFQFILIIIMLSIQIQISLKFVPKGYINNKVALAVLMAKHWTGDKPSSEPMMVKFADAYCGRVESRYGPSQWETSLLCNNVFHWLGAPRLIPL